MGFYLRKSVRVGPIRFNLSKFGVGISAGVKGFRVGTGPRGNYVHMGRGGLYYRATIPSASGFRTPSLPSEKYTPSQPTSNTHEPLREIESGNVLCMQDSSSAELLQELNSKRKMNIIWPYPAVLGMAGLLVGDTNKAPGWLFALVAFLAFALSFYFHQRDQLRKTTVLFYELEPSVEQSYQAFHDTFDELLRCGAAWHIGAEGNVKNQKYHAGASTLVQRRIMRPTKGQPPYVKTNLSIPVLPVGKQSLYFFPDRLLVYAPDGVGAVSYDSLNLSASPTRFIEAERVPHDSQVVGNTWKYVNKNGGPDRRFKDNRQLPIVMYEQVLLGSSTGLNKLVQLSKVGLGIKLHQAIDGLAGCCQQKVN